MDPSPIVLCAALAASPERIVVGTNIILLPLHHPITVADYIIVLNNLSNGRVVCGVGIGDRQEQFDNYGVPLKQHVSHSEESISLFRRLMTEEDVYHKDRYYNVKGITVTTCPVQNHLPP